MHKHEKTNDTYSSRESRIRGERLERQKNSLDEFATCSVNPFAVDIQTGVKLGLTLENTGVELVLESLRHRRGACEK